MPRPKRFPTDRQIREKIARRVQQARVRRAWTREQLADALDVVPETVWRYESGRLPLSVTMLFKVAAVLGLPVEMLVKEEERKTGEAELVAAWRLLNEAEQGMVLHLARRLSGGAAQPGPTETLTGLAEAPGHKAASRSGSST